MKLADRPAALLAVLVDLVLIGFQLGLYVSLVSSRQELHKDVPVGPSIWLFFVSLYFIFREVFQLKMMRKLGMLSFDECVLKHITSNFGNHTLNGDSALAHVYWGDWWNW
jgi:hypothetical protein